MFSPPATTKQKKIKKREKERERKKERRERLVWGSRAKERMIWQLKVPVDQERIREAASTPQTAGSEPSVGAQGVPWLIASIRRWEVVQMRGCRREKVVLFFENRKK